MALSKQPRCSSPVDASNFCRHYLAVSLELLNAQVGGCTARNLARAANDLTVSTAFSGIGCPEQVHYADCAALSCITGAACELRHLWSLEVDQECRYEEAMSPGRAACRFCDMGSGINDRIRSPVLGKCTELSYSHLVKIFKEPNSVKSEMHCEVHGRSCPLRRAQLHVAGTERIYFSICSPTKPGTRGARTVYFIAWAAQRLRVEEEFILHENVEPFPPEMLLELLGDKYLMIGSAVICASKCGNAYDRRRRFTWLVNKKSCVFPAAKTVVPSWSDFPLLYFRECCFSWKAYFNASEDDIENELQWARSRPAHKDKPYARHCTDFQKFLNDWEQRCMDKYEDVCPQGVAWLGQCPENHSTHNGSRNTLCTITKKMNLLWSFTHCRWLTAGELPRAHNIPMPGDNIQEAWNVTYIYI